MSSVKQTCSLVAELNLLCATVEMHQQTASDVCQLDLHTGGGGVSKSNSGGRWKRSDDTAPPLCDPAEVLLAGWHEHQTVKQE